MSKFIPKIISTAAAIVLTAGAMTAAEPIQGYFRVQSSAGIASNTGIVEVQGPMTTAPDVTVEQALTKAGTVMRLRAVPETVNGQLRYKIGNLSSQGIEVFGAPQSNIDAALDELLNDLNTGDFNAMAYSLARKAGSAGYISTGRLLIEAMFEMVAGRLDGEVSSLSAEQREHLGITADQEPLADFARRFNREVSDAMDLFAYLEPTGVANEYRLYFNWLDCSKVSEFYLKNEQNKKSFEIGFECMRQYMNNKPGLASGEKIDDNEAAMWRDWGYDLSSKYSQYYDAETHRYDLTYEMIFADHELLYNWLKMYVERFLDPAKAPDASILGINFKDFATEMHRHELMQGFLKYIPSMQEGQKLYLTNGRFSDGVNVFSTVGTVSDNSSEFGLLAETQANAAGDAAKWVLRPVDETSENDYFALVPNATIEMGEKYEKMAAVYFDFPIAKIDGSKLMFHAFTPTTLGTKTLKNFGDVEYVDLDAETEEIGRQQSALIEFVSDQPVANKVRIVWEAQAGDYDPEVSVDTSEIPVSDEVITIQRVAAQNGETVSHGVLLAAPVTTNHLNNYCKIDGDFERTHSAYVFGSKTYKASTDDELNGLTVTTPWFNEATRIPANSTIIVSGKNKNQNAVSLGEPVDGQHPTTTGVAEIEITDGAAGELYDLQGHRVSVPQPGNIYILDGKKILVR